MPPDLSTQNLADRAAIHDVMMRYARGIDRRDYALVRSCFTPDAHTDYGWIYQGPLDGLIARIESGLRGFAMTMHFMGNELIEVEGDRASMETYCVAYHQPAAPDRGKDLMIMGLRYLDTLVRTPGGWRISHRELKQEWRRDDQAVLA